MNAKFYFIAAYLAFVSLFLRYLFSLEDSCDPWTPLLPFPSQSPLQFDLSKNQIQDFRDDGFLHLKNFIPSNQSAQLSSELSTTYSIHGKTVLSSLDFPGWKNPWIFQFSRFGAAFGHVSSQLLNANSVRLHMDLLFKVKKDSYSFAWHQDALSHPFSLNSRSLSFWIPDRDLENGGSLSFVPGSHKWPSTHPCRQWKSTLLYQAPKECQKEFEKSAEVVENINLGDVIIFDRWVFHRTSTLSNGTRLALVLRTTSSDSLFLSPPSFCMSGNMFHKLPHGLQAYEKVKHAGAVYAQIWPSVLEEEYVRGLPPNAIYQFKWFIEVWFREYTCTIARLFGVHLDTPYK